MFIRLKAVHDPFQQDRWQRISYRTFMGWDYSLRFKYEIRQEVAPTDKQRYTLARGGFMRHVLSTKAQLRIIEHHLDVLKQFSPNPKELSEIEMLMQTTQAYADELIKAAQLVIGTKNKPDTPDDLT